MIKNTMDLSELAVIDRELGLRVTGNNRELAEEMLQMLVKNLATDIQKIQDAYREKNNQLLGEQLHRLHGAVSYCGTPRLKKVVAALEVAVKQKQDESLSELLDLLAQESQLLVEAVRINQD
ncbi:MAG TPA: Hpt domain-containing protein [Gammaproteobacteria bacterium]|nr:Hpt domain-containing protein [Gammaproteobacteria bacterium]